MKKTFSILLVLFVVTVAVFAANVVTDYAGVTWRFRSDSKIKLDTRSTIEDEDGNWTISNTKLGYLSGITGAIQTQLATKPTCTLLTGTASIGAGLSVTQTFSTAFSGAPVLVLTSATNVLPHIISLTASNFVAGGAEAGTVQWLAVYRAAE